MLTREAKQIILKIIPTLNEAQTRWFIAKEAVLLGRGGLKFMHELTGISRTTILRGIEEITNKKKLDISERVRVAGGGLYITHKFLNEWRLDHKICRQ